MSIRDLLPEYCIFATDVLSQPKGKRTIQYDTDIHYQTARALVLARETDIVVITSPLDEEYHAWLRSFRLSTDKVISYNQKTEPRILSDLILENPSPIQELINEEYIFVPFYCSQKDIECAKILGTKVFGCDEKITLQFFDKVKFKEECKALGIPMLEGESHDVNPESPFDKDNLAEIIRRLLANHGKIVIRGSQDSNTRSFFVADSPDIQDLYERLIENQDQAVLIEPLLNVISSPNAQWLIDLNCKLNFIGITAQQFQGFKWAGNLSGQYYSSRVYDYIKSTSRLIAEKMRERGYIGITGIDYIVGEKEIYPIENNARLTGSSFGIELTSRVKKFIPDVQAWKFFKASTSPCSFDELLERLEGIVFDGVDTNCVFPFMTDLLESKGTFIAHLFAEDMYHIDYLQEALSLRGINWA